MLRRRVDVSKRVRCARHLLGPIQRALHRHLERASRRIVRAAAAAAILVVVVVVVVWFLPFALYSLLHFAPDAGIGSNVWLLPAAGR